MSQPILCRVYESIQEKRKGRGGNVTGQLSSPLLFGPCLPFTYLTHSTKELSRVCETMKMLFLKPLFMGSTYTLI